MSEAKNLNQAQADNTTSPTISTFVELTAAVLSDGAFQDFAITVIAEGIIRMERQNVRLLLMNSPCWAQKDRLEHYLRYAEEEEAIIIRVGQQEALQAAPSTSGHRLTEQVIPTTLYQLQTTIHTTFRNQLRIVDSNLKYRLNSDTSESIKYVLQVSRELNGVRDTAKLLSLILHKARDISSSDAGSIYIVNWDDPSSMKGTIEFKITQNDSVDLDLRSFEIPISENSIVGSAVIHQTHINIPDLYALSEDRSKNPFNAQHDKRWDEQIGYQCRSMLTVPMYNIAKRVIGVIQLINRRRPGISKLVHESDFNNQVIPFDQDAVEYTEVVAYQAGIALENALLTEENERMFDGFVHASVKAIEQRDPTTSGHSHRVAKLTVETAKLVDGIATGIYKDLSFNETQLKEIEYASLLHDFGKLGVRENVLIKAKKLYPLEKKLVRQRFQYVRTLCELEASQELVKYLQSPRSFPPGFSEQSILAIRDERLSQLDEYMEFILQANEPTVLEKGGFEKLRDIATFTYKDHEGITNNLLSEKELEALSISRGSLTRDEFSEIQSHVTHTYEFLRKIPWGAQFASVPQIAAKHHEKLDGSGYPSAASGDEIPVQSRIMTIADIFDALTASDRPYKKAVPLPRALDIIQMEVKAKKLDPEIFKIFTESEIYRCVL